MRVGGLGPLAETRAAAGRAMPPFEHVAFAKLLARMEHDLRPRQPRFVKGQRQHVLQLIAIAGRSAKLVRAEAAEQPRGVELVGQPDVDQPVEVRPVGADLDPAQPLGPGSAGRGKRAFRFDDADAGGRVQRFGPARGLAEADGDLRFAPGRDRELAAEGGDAPSVVARAAVARAGLDHRRRQDVAPRAAEEPGADGLGRRIPQARRHEGEAALEIVVGILEKKRRADRLVTDLVHARVRTVLERKIEEGRDAQALRARAVIAQGQQTHVAWIVGRDENDVVDRQIAACRDKRRRPRLIGRLAGRVLGLERREARRAGLAFVEVAQVDDLPRLDDGHAVESEGGEAVLAGVAEGGENLAVVGDHRRHAEFVRHYVSPGARRAVGEAEPGAVGRESERPSRRRAAGDGSTARVS